MTAQYIPQKPKRKAKKKPLRSRFQLAHLKEPFEPDELDWKVVACGITDVGEPWARVVPFVTARAHQNRLDNVVGPENWSSEHSFVGNGFICKVGICFNGTWIYKTDGAEETEIESFKGGASDAFKRACVQWGAGRYLYELGEMYAEFSGVNKQTNGARKIVITDGDDDRESHRNRYYWIPPELPEHALPLIAVKRQKAKKAKEVAKPKPVAHVPAPKTAKALQLDILSLCKRREITPAGLATIAAAKFNVSDLSELTADQLEELYNYIDEGKGEE